MLKREIIGIVSATLGAAGVIALFAMNNETPAIESIGDAVVETTVLPETTTTELLTTTTTTTTTTTEETTTTTTTEATTSETATSTTTVLPAPKPAKVTTTTATPSKNCLTCLGTFKGTYYSGKSAPCKGGSGRTLIDCSAHGQGVKGSVAAKYVYQMYGYKRNGRTKVYIECKGMPSMTGWYYVDDCCGSTAVVDFYYYKNSNCPFRNAGVIFVKVYI